MWFTISYNFTTRLQLLTWMVWAFKNQDLISYFRTAEVVSKPRDAFRLCKMVTQHAFCQVFSDLTD